MTSRQRNQYLTLHVVRELCAGMLQTGQLEKKSRDSLRRITARVEQMIEHLGQPTPTDARAFRESADRLNAAWNGDEAPISRPAFVSIAMCAVADQVKALPRKAVKARKEFLELEGMLFTLYKHFDPDVEDTEAMDEGEEIANEYQRLAA